jgi:hypothetical protein
MEMVSVQFAWIHELDTWFNSSDLKLGASLVKEQLCKLSIAIELWKLDVSSTSEVTNPLLSPNIVSFLEHPEYELRLVCLQSLRSAVKRRKLGCKK